MKEKACERERVRKKQKKPNNKMAISQIRFFAEHKVILPACLFQVLEKSTDDLKSWHIIHKQPDDK